MEDIIHSTRAERLIERQAYLVIPEERKRCSFLVLVHPNPRLEVNCEIFACLLAPSVGQEIKLLCSNTTKPGSGYLILCRCSPPPVFHGGKAYLDKVVFVE